MISHPSRSNIASTSEICCVRGNPGFPAYLPGRIAVLSAYFDESARGDDLLILGGFVSTSEKWVRFSEHCERVKKDFRIPYVHSTQIFSRKSTGIYRHLSNENKRQVIAELTRAITDWTEQSLVVTVIPRQYNNLTTAQWRNENGTSYGACFQWMLIALFEELCLPNAEEKRVSIFLEDGHKHAGEAEQIIRDWKVFADNDPEIETIREAACPLKIGGYGRLTKEDSPPLWAADLISYCFYRQIVYRDKSFANLTQSIGEMVPISGICVDERKIETMKEIIASSKSEEREWRQDMHELIKFGHKFGLKAIKHKKGVMLDLSEMMPEQIEGFLGGGSLLK